ncbi:MAG: glycosyltransferase [Bdellovibrionota bacterium]
MRKTRVFIMGGDRGGWALDTEARLARASLSRIPSIELVDSLPAADVVHTVWPEQLLEDPACEAVLRGPRPVVASFSNDPWALFERVPGLHGFARHWTCVAQSTQARDRLKALAIPRVEQVAYCADFEKFPVRNFSPEEKRALRRKWKLPEAAFLIASFQRDTEGADLSRMKAQKGPDIFRAILLETQKRLGRDSFHVVLAGPRRHWLRRELTRYEIPFTFVGKEVPGDDYPWQSLPARDVAELLAAADLNLVTSRWEGGPRALMESAALGVPVLSSAEGIAEDLLEPAAVFRSLPDAVAKLSNAMRENTLAATVEPQRRRLEERHSPDSIHKSWAAIYERLESPPAPAPAFLREFPVHHPRLHTWLRRAKTVQGRVRRAIGTGDSPRVLELGEDQLDAVNRALSETPGVFTAFSGVAVWRKALAAGWNPSCAGVLRPVALARSDAALVVDPDCAGSARAAIAAGVPVVFAESEEFRETTGYAGIAYPQKSGAREEAVRLATEYREGLGLSAWQSGEVERHHFFARLRELNSNIH